MITSGKQKRNITIKNCMYYTLKVCIIALIKYNYFNIPQLNFGKDVLFRNCLSWTHLFAIPRRNMIFSFTFVSIEVVTQWFSPGCIIRVWNRRFNCFSDRSNYDFFVSWSSSCGSTDLSSSQIFRIRCYRTGRVLST